MQSSTAPSSSGTYAAYSSPRGDDEISRPNLSVAERLSALNDLEDAWLRADFTPLPAVMFPLENMTFINSTNGALFGSTGTLWESEEIMRLPTTFTVRPCNKGPRLRLGTISTHAGRRVVKELDVLEDSNLLTVVSLEIIGNRFSALVFDFYTADTFEPHPDAAHPCMILHCETSLSLASPELDPGGDISEYDPAVMDSCGDHVFFVVSHFDPMESLTTSGWRRDELSYCICWREGRLVPLRMESAYQSVTSVYFISESAILIPRADRHCLEICTLSKCSIRHRVLHTALYLQLPPLASALVTNVSCTAGRDSTSFTPNAHGHTNFSAPLFSTPGSESVCTVHVILKRRVGYELSLHAFLLVTRCATLDELANRVPSSSRYEWSAPRQQYLRPEGQLYTHNEEPVSLSDPIDRRAYSMESQSWLRQGFVWLDGGDIGEDSCEPDWAIHGQRLLAFLGDPQLEETDLTLPLRLFDFNAYNVRRAGALVQSITQSLSNVSASDDGQEDMSLLEGRSSAIVAENLLQSEFGRWTQLPNGNKLAVVDGCFTMPGGFWWMDDLVSNMPFVVTQIAQAERWPMLVVHGNYILRKREPPSDRNDAQAEPTLGTTFEVFRVGNDIVWG
ncbi:hypothetical protein PENSPDRAFT_751433 [Peniophora sp. CONT]|nr:hypothetical protein PENSPDRAFT_751433 [Peniophora sp. CONT]